MWKTCLLGLINATISGVAIPASFLDHYFCNRSLFTISTLYMMAPLASLVELIPALTKVKVSVERLQEFEMQLNSSKMVGIKHGDRSEINKVFDNIHFEDVTYQYFHEKNYRSFVFGPVNLTITRGEMIFVTGDNGSGKSTFVNLIIGLLGPKSGNIYLNGNKISEVNYPYYSNQISAIFTNHYMFNQNYDDFDIKEMSCSIEKYISVMRLDRVLKFNETRNYSDQRLSKGQQKRLAMIYALMENRQIFI